MTDIVEQLRQEASKQDMLCCEDMLRAADEIERLRALDREAATYVESVICMRTKFTGEQPYVGWKGLGLALTEVLDERDRLLVENRGKDLIIEEYRRRAAFEPVTAEQLAEACAMSEQANTAEEAAMMITAELGPLYRQRKI